MECLVLRRLTSPASATELTSRPGRNGTRGSAWGGSAGEYRDGELNVVDDNELGLIDVANLHGGATTIRAPRSGLVFRCTKAERVGRTTVPGLAEAAESRVAPGTMTGEGDGGFAWGSGGV